MRLNKPTFYRNKNILIGIYLNLVTDLQYKCVNHNNLV